MAEKTKTINCKQCGYVNEGERVYCHNCGTKLDRTLLPSDDKSEETLEKKQKRIRKAVMPSRGFFAGFGKMLVTTLLWAVLLAALIQIARKPDGVPEKVKGEDLLDGRQIAIELEDAMQAPAPQRLTFTQKDINTYLQSSIKSKATGLIGDEVKFIRAFVNLDDSVIRITTEQTLFDYPVYGTACYKLEIKDKKVVATSVGGNFGRLPVHPKIMMYIDTIFQKLWDALTREKKLVDQFQTIDVHKDRIDLVSKPPTP